MRISRLFSEIFKNSLQ